MLEAFGRRDLDGVMAHADPDIQLRPAVVGGLERTVYSGREGVRQFIADLDAIWSEFEVRAEEFRDLGDGILVLGRTIARGTVSRVELDTGSGFIFGLRDGKVCSFRSFVSKEEALEAAGLSEDGGVTGGNAPADRE